MCLINRFGKILILILLSLNTLNAKEFTFTEDTDIKVVKSLSDSVDYSKGILYKEEKWIPNSKYAILWGLLPGGGQIYNRKYWKLPIVWGAFTTCFYAFKFNQQKYTEYHEAYRDMSSEDPSKNTAWLAFTPKDTKPEDFEKYKYLLNNFKRGDEYFHRWRDISIVVGIGIYALSIIDAYVDAELATFDISSDLSMTVYPKIDKYEMNSYTNYGLSIGCSLNF